MRVYTLLILFVLGGLFMCYGQDAEGFPKYVDTGDKEADAANYAKAKEAWINSHPNEPYEHLYSYEKLNQPQNSGIRLVPVQKENYIAPTIMEYETYMSMSKEAQAKIDANPHLYKVAKSHTTSVSIENETIVEKRKIDNFNDLPKAKQDYIKANLAMFEVKKIVFSKADFQKMSTEMQMEVRKYPEIYEVGE